MKKQNNELSLEEQSKSFKEPDYSSAPPVYTEEEKQEFLDKLIQYQRKHPILRSGQKKFRNRMTHLTPKKKKRK
jgi:hypothetical protein